MQSAPRGSRPMQPEQRANAFDHHQRAECTEQQHVADRDRQLDLAQAFQQGEDPHPEKRARQAADQQDVSHLEIDIAAPPVSEHTRNRGTDQLVRRGSDGDGGRYADEDQQRRQQKAAADAEHPGEKSDRRTEAEQNEDVERHLGDRQVDVHGARRRRLRAVVARRLPAKRACSVNLQPAPRREKRERPPSG